MGEKTLVVLIVFLASIFLLLESVGAYGCDIRDATACTGGSNIIVMKLNSTINTHTETYNGGSYGKVICCDFGGPSRACNSLPNGNKVAKLSASTNAHVDQPQLGSSTYGTNVCLENLSCIYTNNGCPPLYLIEMYTLSNFTNAQIGGIGAYSNDRVCCNNTYIVLTKHCNSTYFSPPVALCPDAIKWVCYPPPPPVSSTYPEAIEQPCCGTCCLKNPYDTSNCTANSCGNWNDQCGGYTNCGQCPTQGDVCYNQYCCTPKTCVNIGVACGTNLPAGCGTTINCNCPGGQVCKPDNKCCTPDCEDHVCGLDPVCGTLSCGPCNTGFSCDSNGKCIPNNTPGCSFISAYWNKINETGGLNNTAIEGETIPIYVKTTTDCQGNMTHLTIFEEDSGSDDSPQYGPISNDIIIGSTGLVTSEWIAEYLNDSGDDGDPPEFYIKAEIQALGLSVTSLVSYGEGSPLLYVYDRENYTTQNCSLIHYCRDYNESGACLEDPCRVLAASILEVFKKACGPDGCNNLHDPQIWWDNCQCYWNSSNQCDVKADPKDCGDDDDPSSGFEYGTCYVTSGIIKDCNTEPVGFMTSQWAGRWEWASTNNYTNNASCMSNSPPCNSIGCIQDPPLSGFWRCDPNDKKTACELGGTATIECPAGIQLPFFNKYNLILAVLVIAGIYALIIFRKKK